jgi:hypothetical protein
MNANDLDAIGERFTRLEREVRLWKRAATVTIVLLVVLIAFSSTPRTREARAADSSARDLVVRSLTIVGEDGKRRIALATGEDGPGLTLLDEKGTPRVILLASKDGPGFALLDEKGTPRAGLTADKDGPVLDLRDERGTRRVALGTKKNGPALLLHDEKGTARAILAVATFADVGSSTKDGAVLRLYDEKRTLRAFLFASKDGPGLALSDKDGKPIWRAP